MTRRVFLWLGFWTVISTLTLTPFGADLREPYLLSYDPLAVATVHPPPERMVGYKTMQKIMVGKASAFFEKRLGKSYWTKEVAPILLDSLYSSVLANASGRLSVKDPFSVLNGAANRLADSGKRKLTTASKKNFPELPVVGNLLEDLTKSQYLSLEGKRVRYNMSMKKRLAPEFKFGKFSFSGGAETYLKGTTFSRKSVASFGYKDLDNTYRVQVCGRNVQFDVSWSPVNLRLDWNPQVVKFDLKFNLGCWF